LPELANWWVQFSPESQSIQEQNSEILKEVLKYLVQNPGVAVVIESHKFSAQGSEEKDSEITRGNERIELSKANP